MMQRMIIRIENFESVTSMVTEGENMRYKDYIKHVEDATTLTFMSKMEIYDKLINKKVRGRCMRSLYLAKDATIKREKVEKRIQFVSMKEGDMIQSGIMDR